MKKRIIIQKDIINELHNVIERFENISTTKNETLLQINRNTSLHINQIETSHQKEINKINSDRIEILKKIDDKQLSVSKDINSKISRAVEEINSKKENVNDLYSNVDKRLKQMSLCINTFLHIENNLKKICLNLNMSYEQDNNNLNDSITGENNSHSNDRISANKMIIGVKSLENKFSRICDQININLKIVEKEYIESVFNVIKRGKIIFMVSLSTLLIFVLIFYLVK